MRRFICLLGVHKLELPPATKVWDHRREGAAEHGKYRAQCKKMRDFKKDLIERQIRFFMDQRDEKGEQKGQKDKQKNHWNQNLPAGHLQRPLEGVVVGSSR